MKDFEAALQLLSPEVYRDDGTDRLAERTAPLNSQEKSMCEISRSKLLAPTLPQWLIPRNSALLSSVPSSRFVNARGLFRHVPTPLISDGKSNRDSWIQPPTFHLTDVWKFPRYVFNVLDLSLRICPNFNRNVRFFLSLKILELWPLIWALRSAMWCRRRLDLPESSTGPHQDTNHAMSSQNWNFNSRHCFPRADLPPLGAPGVLTINWRYQSYTSRCVTTVKNKFKPTSPTSPARTKSKWSSLWNEIWNDRELRLITQSWAQHKPKQLPWAKICK